MGFITLLQANWKLIVTYGLIIVIFFSGWHLRGVSDKAKEVHAIAMQIKHNDEIDVDYNDSISTINKTTEKLNNQLMKTYEESNYDCVIPVSGVRILQQANR